MKNNIKGISYKIIDWSLHFITYAIILVFVATFFDSFKIDDTHLYLYGGISIPDNYYNIRNARSSQC